MNEEKDPNSEKEESNSINDIFWGLLGGCFFLFVIYFFFFDIFWERLTS